MRTVLPELKHIVFRIGVNIGDIIVEDDNLHGEGINVAARLESLCDPSGILLSEEAARYVDGKIDAALEFVEERSVKNIERPVRLWRIDPSGAPQDAVQASAVPPGKKRWRYGLLLGGVLVAAFGVLLWHQPWLPKSEAARLDHMAFALPDKPSIVVLPFDNLTGDDDQDYLSDGITEHLIATLGQLPNLFVVARNSSFAFKGSDVTTGRVDRG